MSRSTTGARDGAGEGVSPEAGVLQLRLVPPWASRDRHTAERAPRPATLAGAVVGLLANGKPNGDRLVDLMAAELDRRHGIAGVVAVTKEHPSLPADAGQLAALADRCDLVLSAVGD